MSILREYTVINIKTGDTKKVLGVGPRDAVLNVAGWGAISIVNGWVYSGEWKVKGK